MRINKSTPIEIDNRLFINCNDITYLIGEKGCGKSSEVARQAAMKEATIISPTSIPFKNYGISHGDDTECPVRYITLWDIMQGQQFNFEVAEDEKVHFCIDDGRKILEELISQAFDGIPVKIDFMTLDAGDE